MHAHRDMVVTSQYYGVETLGVTPDDIHFSAAKLFFAYGLGNAMTMPLWTGGQAVLFAGRPTPEIMADHIARYRPTLYYAVPTLFAAQLHALENAGADFSSLRACVSAGEPLPATLFERWRDKTGLTILDGIGTTEILHIFIGNGPGDARPGTSGRLVPGYEARIVDDADQPVATGEIGNLMIKGGSVTSRYWNQPERTAAAITDGWIRRGARGRGHRPARRRGADQTRGARHPQRPRRRVRRAGRGPQDLLPTGTGALQIPPLGAFRRRAAQDGNGEDPEVQVAGVTRTTPRHTRAGGHP